MISGEQGRMPREKKFKWSKEDYTLREFIETFSHCLPVTLYITEGWMGRDEDNAFSSDEVSVGQSPLLPDDNFPRLITYLFF